MEIIYVIPDYYSKYPKACMGGWGKNQLTVTPNGNVLPCPAAHTFELPRATVRGELSGLDLGGVAPLPSFPGNGLDARSLPQLRPPRGGFRRLPLPGVPAHRRRGAHGSGLPPLARPRDRRRGRKDRQPEKRTGARTSSCPAS